MIESLVDSNVEVKSASVKALASFLLSTDAKLMATVVDLGYLENITAVVTSSKHEELLKTALWGLSNFVTTESSVAKFIQCDTLVEKIILFMNNTCKFVICSESGWVISNAATSCSAATLRTLNDLWGFDLVLAIVNCLNAS